jgi:hypothetical protein
METLMEIRDAIKALEQQDLGAKRTIIGKMNSDTAILGFSRGTDPLELRYGDKKILVGKPYDQCATMSCLCVCVGPGMAVNADPPEIGTCTQAAYCITEEDYGEFDIHPHVLGNNMRIGVGLDKWPYRAQPVHGILLLRGIALERYGGHDPGIQGDSLFGGRFSLQIEYAEKDLNPAVAICTNPDETSRSCVAPEPESFKAPRSLKPGDMDADGIPDGEDRCCPAACAKSNFGGLPVETEGDYKGCILGKQEPTACTEEGCRMAEEVPETVPETPPSEEPFPEQPPMPGEGTAIG